MNSRSETGMSLLLLLCFITISQVLQQAEAVYIDIPSSGTKCVSENIQTHTVVLAYYYVVTHIVNTTESIHEDYQPHSISVKVISPYGNNLHHNENVTQGQFGFTTSEGGSYAACFSMDTKDQEAATVSLEWKTGISAKDWDAVAKKEKIEGVELELKKLQQTVLHIHNYLLYLKDKEAKMRETSERTNARVSWLSIMSLGLCILVSALQLWYLKRFFIKKKLI